MSKASNLHGLAPCAAKTLQRPASFGVARLSPSRQAGHEGQIAIRAQLSVYGADRRRAVVMQLTSVPKDSPQYEHIVDIWGNVLAAHYHGCVVGVYEVQFVTRSSKVLSDIAVSE